MSAPDLSVLDTRPSAADPRPYDFPDFERTTLPNGLQVIAYFTTVFIAAPLALITGLGMSPALSTRFHGISKRATKPAKPIC